MAAPAERSILIEAFVREGSRQSEQARDFLANLERRRRGLRVIVRDVAGSPSDLARLKMLSGHFGVGEPRIPSVYAAGRLLVGFRDAATTGRQIEDLLRMQVFTREGCPRLRHGHALRPRPGPALSRPERRGLRGHPRRERPGVVRAADAAVRHPVPGFPTFHLCGRLMVGYSGLETTGAEIEAVLRAASAPSAPKRAGAFPASGPVSIDPRTGFGPAHRAALLAAIQLPTPVSEGGTTDEAELPLEAELPGEAESPGALYGPGLGPRSERAPPPESIRVPMLGRLPVRDWGCPCSRS